MKKFTIILIIIIILLIIGLIFCFDRTNASNWFVALATLLLFFVAIFREWIQTKLWETKIRLESINFTNDEAFPHITNDNHGNRLLFFHFKIINDGRFEAKNIRLRINRIVSYKGDGTNDFINYIEDKNKILDVPCSLIEDNNEIINLNVKNYEVKVFLHLREFSSADKYIENSDYIDANAIRLYFVLYNYVIELLKDSNGFDLHLEITGDNNYFNEDYFVKIRFLKYKFFGNLDKDNVKNNFLIELINKSKKN